VTHSASSNKQGVYTASLRKHVNVSGKHSCIVREPFNGVADAFVLVAPRWQVSFSQWVPSTRLFLGGLRHLISFAATASHIVCRIEAFTRWLHFRVDTYAQARCVPICSS
jgi:hypothetical protein